MDEVVLREHEEESKSKKKDHLVEEFKSAAAPLCTVRLTTTR
jgi:hypothetical protein